MRTRDEVSENHWHRDQANYDPTTSAGAVLRSLLTPAPKYAARLAALRAAWAPRNTDPRTMILPTDEEPQ